MEEKSLQEKQDFVATVEEKQQDGEWVVTAQAVGTLKELTEWAANGVGVGSSCAFDGLDHFTLGSAMWVDETFSLVTDEHGEVVEPAEDMHAPYGYLHWGEGAESEEKLVAKAKKLAGFGTHLLRTYAEIHSPVQSLSEGDVQEMIEAGESRLVLAHAEPLEYSVENVSAYIRYAFGLDEQRLSLSPAADDQDATLNVLDNYVYADDSGLLTKEEAENWERVYGLYYCHPYARNTP